MTAKRGAHGLGKPITLEAAAKRSAMQRPILVRAIGKVTHVWFEDEDVPPNTQMFELDCATREQATDTANALRDPMLLALVVEGAWRP
jgi:hypothetical protein